MIYISNYILISLYNVTLWIWGDLKASNLVLGNQYSFVLQSQNDGSH